MADTLKDKIIVARIASQRKIIITSPPIGVLNPKNATDHKMFNTSWTQKTIKAILAES